MKIIQMFSSIDHYQDIDTMPIYNWFKIQETSDMRWMLLKPRQVNKNKSKELNKALQNITKQYIDAFGISPEYNALLKLQRQLMILQINLATTKNRTLLTFIEVKKREIKMCLDKAKGGMKVSLPTIVRKYNGGVLNQKQMSVKEFFETLEQMKRENEEQKRQFKKTV